MTKTSEPVQLYTLSLRREVPITGKDGVPTGEVKHLTEHHKGCTWDESLAIRARTTHVADGMVEKLRLGQPGKIDTSFDLGSPINMHAPASPRKARVPYESKDTSKWGKHAQRAPQARETPIATRKPGGGTYADLVNKMAEEEVA